MTILERLQWCRSGVSIVNFEQISHLVLVFLLLTLNMKLPAGPPWENIILHHGKKNLLSHQQHQSHFYNYRHASSALFIPKKKILHLPLKTLKGHLRNYKTIFNVADLLFPKSEIFQKGGMSTIKRITHRFFSIRINTSFSVPSNRT